MKKKRNRRTKRKPFVIQQKTQPPVNTMQILLEEINRMKPIVESIRNKGVL